MRMLQYLRQCNMRYEHLTGVDRAKGITMPFSEIVEPHRRGFQSFAAIMHLLERPWNLRKFKKLILTQRRGLKKLIQMT